MFSLTLSPLVPTSPPMVFLSLMPSIFSSLCNSNHHIHSNDPTGFSQFFSLFETHATRFLTKLLILLLVWPHYTDHQFILQLVLNFAWEKKLNSVSANELSQTFSCISVFVRRCRCLSCCVTSVSSEEQRCR